jgi:hypothetical protein
MRTQFSTPSNLTRELAILAQQVLVWLPTILACRASSAELREHCRGLRHRLVIVRRIHKPAWAAFALAAGREGFTLWNGDRMESAHQAVATIADRLYRLLGGRRIARGTSGQDAPAQLLRLELQLRQLTGSLLPGFDIFKPAMPLSIFQALAWELRQAHAEVREASTSAAQPSKPAAPHAVQITPGTEWDRLGPERRRIFHRFSCLRKDVAAAKEILGKVPSKAEEGHLQTLVQLGFLRKPGGKSGKDRRGYCLGRPPEGFKELHIGDADRVLVSPVSL